MKKKTHYKAAPFGKNAALGRTVSLKGFPSPQEVAAAEQTTKVTLALGTQAVDFFKEQARQSNMPYQVMIRRLLDAYAARFSS